MRFTLCLTLLFFGFNTQIAAQQETDTANAKVKFVPISPYRFPEFTPGMVFLRNKDTVSVYLNYHYVRNEMQFINEHGDTLVLKDPLTVAKIHIENDEFYFYKEKWIQKIEAKAGIVLGYWTNVLVELKLSRPGYAGYGQGFEQGVRKVWMEGYSNFDVHTKDLYFFGDGFGNFTKANRVNLLAYFEKQAPLIKRYLNMHTTDFNNLDHLKQVLQFCDTLE